MERGWSPSTTHPERRIEELHAIAADANEFLAACEDVAAHGAMIDLPDGSRVPRLPGFQRWMWDGEFAGSIGLRWQTGTPELPAWCHGHIGYGVVPWKRRRGYATAALRFILPEARKIGLPYVELVTEPDNSASQRVILANGGEFVERFCVAAHHGGGEALRYRITL